MRLDLQAANRERSRLETRLVAKERELGTLANKASWMGHAVAIVSCVARRRAAGRAQLACC